MHHIVLSIFIILLFGACANEQVEEYEYFKFARQVTPSGKYVIYDYARNEAMAFNSDIYRKELFKIGEEFKEGKGLYINSSISEWLSDDTLLVYNFSSDSKQPKDTLPIKTKISPLGDFIIKTVFYQSNSAVGINYEFDSVATTADSILFWMTKDNDIKILRFPLGATTIQSKSNSITHISIDNQLTKNMDFVYKNADGTFTRGLPGIGITSYNLKPTK
jgi:hypothetical protein